MWLTIYVAEKLWYAKNHIFIILEFQYRLVRIVSQKNNSLWLIFGMPNAKARYLHLPCA